MNTYKMFVLDCMRASLSGWWACIGCMVFKRSQGREAVHGLVLGTHIAIGCECFRPSSRLGHFKVINIQLCYISFCGMPLFSYLVKNLLHDAEVSVCNWWYACIWSIWFL